MPVCGVCGTSFETDEYHVVLGGTFYDSIECALRVDAARRRRTDATSLWVDAARKRIGIDDSSPNVEPEPSDL